MGKTLRIKVADCTVTPSLNLVEHNGRSIKITPRTMDLLVYLVEHRNEVVSVEELIGNVWHGRVVSATQIYKGIGQLREILGEDGNGRRIIQTVPKRGYRFLADVTPLEPQPRPGHPCHEPIDSPRVKPKVLALTAVTLLALSIVGFYVGHSASNGGLELTEPLSLGFPTQYARSVAVLPFENMSPNPEDFYFATGIHEEILNQLAKIKDLKVIDRSLVLQYKGTRRPITAIAKELNVDTIMTGSVRYAATKVRITTRLVAAQTGAQLWSEVYERDLKDIFAVQTDIAARVAGTLRSEITAVERANLERPITASPEAYELYLRSGASETTPGLAAALRHLYLDRALALDPNFAQAHARKASVYALSLVDNIAVGLAGFADSAALAEKVQMHAEKALELDPNLTDAYLALARLHQYRWHWRQAQEAYKKAFELSPNNPDVLRAHSYFSSYLGDDAVALAMARRAVELDPTKPGPHFRLGTVLLNSRDSDGAIAAFRSAIRLDPGYTLAHIYLGIAEATRANYTDAATELRVAERLIREDPLPDHLTLIAYGYSRMGSESDVERIIGIFEKEAAHRHVGPGHWVFAFLARGQHEKALERLALIVDRVKGLEPDVSYYNLMLLRTNAFSDSVLERAEFRSLRNRLGKLGS